jgi:hypothetical protein
MHRRKYMGTYFDEIIAKLYTLPASTYAPIDRSFSNAQQYHNQSCPNQVIKCQLCDDEMPRHEMAKHLNSSDNIGIHLMKLTSAIAEKDVIIAEMKDQHEKAIAEMKSQHTMSTDLLKKELASIAAMLQPVLKQENPTDGTINRFAASVKALEEILG